MRIAFAALYFSASFSALSLCPTAALA
ncbi:cytochrome c family protein, partial [Sinorhizobium medicae]